MTNSPERSDRNQVICAEIIARAWQDEAYKSQLLANPRQTLTEAGMLLPESTIIQVLENTADVLYVVLPQESTFADFQDDIATGLAPLLPLSANQEIIIRQVTENVKYFLLPRKPQVAGGVEDYATIANTTLGPEGNIPQVTVVLDACFVVACNIATNSMTPVVTLVATVVANA